MLAQDEVLVRARPEPDTWCAVEYAQHVVNAISGIEWAGRIFATGHSPNRAEEPADLAGVFEHETHDCGRFGIAGTLGQLAVAAGSMADFTEPLAPEEQGMIATYVPSQVISTTAVVRHALHDAEHHLLDIRRGIARQQLRA